MAGKQNGAYGQTRDVDAVLGQQLHLNIARDAKLFFEPLLLGGLSKKVLDTRGHEVERICKLAQLIARAHLHLVAEIALTHMLGSLAQRMNRTGDRAREDEPDEDCGHLDDEEQDGKKNHRGHEQLTQVVSVWGRAEAPRTRCSGRNRRPEAELDEQQVGLFGARSVEASGFGTTSTRVR